MAKYHGMIGYTQTVLTGPGKWEEKTVEKEYYGNLLRNYVKRESSGGVNDNINIANDISIVADDYAKAHSHQMRYATFRGAKWKINNIDVKGPRLILTLGGVYNG